MKNTYSNVYGGQSPDLQVWLREQSGDNCEQLSRLRRNLRVVRKAELTPRQAQMVELYFDQDMTMTEISKELCVCPSTVSRTISRAKQRLYRFLRYSL
jgi:RNA polymerase sigma factor (sigma-70 family)